MNRIIVFILFVVFQYQFVYSIENIYEDAMTHFVEEIVDDHETTIREKNKDSIYKHTLVFESNALYMHRKIPKNIQGYRIIDLGISEIYRHLESSSEGVIRFFIIDQMDYCDHCQAPIFIPFIEVVVVKTNLKLIFRDLQVHNISYQYNPETNTFDYKHIVSGTLGNSDAICYLRRKGFKGIYNTIDLK